MDLLRVAVSSPKEQQSRVADSDNFEELFALLETNSAPSTQICLFLLRTLSHRTAIIRRVQAHDAGPLNGRVHLWEACATTAGALMLNKADW